MKLNLGSITYFINKPFLASIALFCEDYVQGKLWQHQSELFQLVCCNQFCIQLKKLNAVCQLH